MSYSAWAASLHIPHLQQAQTAASDAGTVLPSTAALSIEYECSCGRLHPHLAFLFWCRHCSALQCQQCTMQQVDTYFCPACLNSVFTTSAFANQNRCEQCVECPSCFHILSPMHRPSGQFAYVCEFCKWCSEDFTPHSHDAGHSHAPAVPTKSPLVAAESNLLSARVKEAEQNSGANATFAALLTHYRSRTAKTNPSGIAPKRAQLFDEFESLLAASDDANPLTAAGSPLLSRVASLSTPTHAAPNSTDLAADSNVGRWMAWREERETMLHQHHYVLASEPRTNRFDPIPRALLGHFDEADKGRTSVNDMSSLPQLVSHPSGAHLWTNELVPRRKALATKLAHRCRTCHQFIVKPSPGANKATMEIHMAAITHLPTVTIGQFRPMRVGKSNSIILYFHNPVEKEMKLWLTQPTDADATAAEKGPVDLAAPAESIPREPSATVEFVRSSTVIAAYDDLLEENEHWQDDTPKPVEAEPMLVVYRHLSKVGLLLHVTPTTHTRSTQFDLRVHVQTDPVVAGATDAPAATPGEVISFPMRINLGFATEA